MKKEFLIKMQTKKSAFLFYYHPFNFLLFTFCLLYWDKRSILMLLLRKIICKRSIGIINGLGFFSWPVLRE